MKRILVTGTNGFIGKYISEMLIKNGFLVSGMGRQTTCQVTGLVKYYMHDLKNEIKILDDFDYIIHAAGYVPKTKDTFLNFNGFEENNIVSMKNIVKFSNIKKIKNIIFISSISIYGDIRNKIINEDSDIINQNYYGLTKYVAEKILVDRKEINSIILRIPGVIGIGNDRIWIYNLVNKMMHNKDVEISSPNFATNAFISIYDLGKFILHLLNSDYKKSDIILLASDNSMKVIDIVDTVKKLLKSSSNYNIVEGKNAFSIDISHARSLGYKTSPLKKCIENFVHDLIESR